MHTRLDTTHTYMKMGAGEGQRVKKIKREEHHETGRENRSSPSYSLLGQLLP